jgi:hypothetical protein
MDEALKRRPACGAASPLLSLLVFARCVGVARRYAYEPDGRAA